MKKKYKFIFILLFTFSLNSMLFAIDYFKFSLTPEAGFLNGHIYEYVFDELNGEEHTLSLLDWELKNIPYVQINTQVDLFKYICLGVSGKAALSVFCGSMQDYDWQNSYYPTKLTNYSKHTNSLNDLYTLHLFAGANLVNLDKIKISLFFSYDYDYFHFDGIDGYYEYESNNWEKIYLTGKVISYIQEYEVYSFGFNADYKINNRFCINSCFYISPKLSSANCLDFHYKRVFEDKDTGKIYPSTLFWDELTKMTIIKGNVTSNYAITNHSKIGCSFNYHIVPKSKGPDALTGTDLQSNFKKDSFAPTGAEGGTKFFLWSIGINYTYTF